MEQLKIELTFCYNDGKPSKNLEISLWHGHKPFAFSDDKTLQKIMVHGKSFYTQEEYDAFYKGITVVRDKIVSFVNL
jgi:hypothetical protein